MKVLIFHGYLLRGTGSNVYNASLATALARLGHEVHLLSQDRVAPDLGADADGSVTIHNPEIGGLLPVFVRDAYEGFEVKTFLELSEAELDAYVGANVTAVERLVTELGGVDAALANHLIMGPVILGRAGLRYALKVHGSDLSYTVLADLDRFRPYAEEACAGANGILVGSGHIAERLALAVDDPEIRAKVRLGPPGVDTELFAPIAVADRSERLRELAAELRLGREGSDRAQGGWTKKRRHEQRNVVHSPASSWDRDATAAADALDWYAEGQGPRVIFVGKLIVSKGVDLLLAAWPLVHSANADARLLVVGFGALEPVLQRVWAGLGEGNLAPLRELAERGRGMEGADDVRLSILTAFLNALPADYAELAAAAGSSVKFAGRLEHDEVAVPVAASDALVFPSTFPEAFGMVAAEAASTGALPVSTAHSGAAEVSAALAAELAPAVRGLVSFELGADSVAAIAERLRAWLTLAPEERAAASATLRQTVERLWSWEGVARGVLAASAGELDGLRRPAAS